MVTQCHQLSYGHLGHLRSVEEHQKTLALCLCWHETAWVKQAVTNSQFVYYVCNYLSCICIYNITMCIYIEVFTTSKSTEVLTANTYTSTGLSGFAQCAQLTTQGIRHWYSPKQPKMDRTMYM